MTLDLGAGSLHHETVQRALWVFKRGLTILQRTIIIGGIGLPWIQYVP